MKNDILYFIFFLFISCTKRERITPTIASISESVYASGIVKAKEQYQVYSDVTGIVQVRHISSGEIVIRGDPIFTIQNLTSELTTENSQLSLRKSQENLKKIRELERQTELAKRKYLQDSLMYSRQKNLWDHNVGSKVELEEKEIALQSSRVNYQNSLTDLRQTRVDLKADYEASKNNLKMNQRIEGNYIIRSEFDGRVYKTFIEEGELITPQKVIAVIGQSDKFYIEAYVDEDDITKVNYGQIMFITMDSYKDTIFKALVTKIHPYLNEGSGTFTVEGVFIKAPQRLYPNLTMESNILIREKKNALVIPRDYLIEDTYVLIESDKKVKVKVGLKNYDYVEILSGISKDQYIYKP